MNFLRVLIFGCLGSLAIPSAVLAQSSDRPDGMRFVPDVEGQFYNLTQFPDPLGFNVGGSPDPSTCRHYQSLVRVDGSDGTPFFLVTRSGNTPFPPGEIGCDDSDGETRNGHLIVFRMGSRDKNGERLRSNRLMKGRNFDATQPDLEDKASIYYTVVDGGLVLSDGAGGIPPKVYQHPGGMQVVGNMLAVALETPRETGPRDACVACNAGLQQFCGLCYDYESAPNRTLIMFLDVSDPEHPEFRSQFVPKNSGGETLAGAGVLALTPLANGRYLMMVTGGKNTTLFFYRSTLTDLSDPALSWELVRSLPGPDVEDAHQTLHFLRQGDINGQLYLAGARGIIFFDDRDRIDLYKVDCQTPAECAPGENITMTVKYNGRRITPKAPTGGFTDLANLAAASGFYVSPSGELIFYATEHDNDGPNRSVKAGEWRHRDVVRPGSPTVLPSAKVNGPYEVAEGGSVQLSGSASPPITKAWIQGFWGQGFESPGWIADYADYDKDDFGDLAAFEPVTYLGGVLFTQNDKVQSWKWFAPPGCSISAVDLHQGAVDETVTLAGTGALVTAPDLTQVMNDGGTDDINAELDAVDFLSNCDTLYSMPVALTWDLNQDSVYESSGSTISFSAASLDGPSVVSVDAKAQQGGSESAPLTTMITVRNVAPWITAFTITDNAGRSLGIDVPFALTGLPVAVGAAFTDPGLPDRQTASIAWGDGSTDVQSAFTVFDEAYGDGTGRLGHAHRYLAGGQFTVTVAVQDDDGGRGTQGAAIRILTPEQAVGEIIALLDAIIAATTDDKVRADLRQARDALAGRNEYSNNGALNKIRNGNVDAALAMLGITLDWLARAASGGADTATLSVLVQQVAAALKAA